MSIALRKDLPILQNQTGNWRQKISRWPASWTQNTSATCGTDFQRSISPINRDNRFTLHNCFTTRNLKKEEYFAGSLLPLLTVLAIIAKEKKNWYFEAIWFFRLVDCCYSGTSCVCARRMEICFIWCHKHSRFRLPGICGKPLQKIHRYYSLIYGLCKNLHWSMPLHNVMLGC